MLAKKHKAFLAAKEKQKSTSGVAQLNAASSAKNQKSELDDKYHGDQDYMDYQQAMGLMKEDFGMVQVGNIVTGTNFLSPGEPGTKKTVSFADVVKKGLPKRPCHFGPTQAVPGQLCHVQLCVCHRLSDARTYRRQRSQGELQCGGDNFQRKRVSW